MGVEDGIDQILYKRELERANNMRYGLLTNAWEHCREEEPDCPHVKENKPCPQLLIIIELNAKKAMRLIAEEN